MDRGKGKVAAEPGPGGPGRERRSQTAATRFCWKMRNPFRFGHGAGGGWKFSGGIW